MKLDVYEAGLQACTVIYALFVRNKALIMGKIRWGQEESHTKLMTHKNVI